MSTHKLPLHIVTSTFENGSLRLTVPAYPDLSAFGDRYESLEQELLENAGKIVERIPAINLHCQQLASPPEVRKVRVKVPPPERRTEWRHPVSMEFHAVCWKQGRSAVAYIPSLDIHVVASRPRQLDQLIRQHVLFALRRRKMTDSIERLMWYQRYETVEVERVEFEGVVKTPKQLAREALEESRKPVLPLVATRMSVIIELAPDIVGMDDVVLEMADRLTAASPRSLLLVGPSGVGKTAAVHAVFTNRRDLGLDQLSFWTTSGARIVAGMSAFGAWQERCAALCREAAETRSIVHFGSLVELMSLGQSEHNLLGVADFLRPYIGRGELLAIVECTPEQLTLIETTAPKMLEVFAVVKVEEPDIDAGRAILRGVADQLAKRRAEPVEDEAIAELDRLHRRYATYSTIPGRPLRFLRNLVEDLPAGQPIRPVDVRRSFSNETGLPLFLLDDSVPFELEATREWFAERVIGQDKAIDAIVELLATVKAGMTRPQRPIASLLFAGPTGVGKTELAKALAEFLYRDRSRMTRIDMSEYAVDASVDRLIGDAFGSEGLLTSKVREQPFGVVLLDEFEKAHPRVFDMLLQVLGEGRLTDAGGRLADFRNSVIVMTSNLGTGTFGRPSVGFGTSDGELPEAEQHFTNAVRQHVRPEFFNRIDRIIPFLPLDKPAICRIAGRELDLLSERERIRHHDVALEFSEQVTDEVVRRGFDPRFGARPLKRAIDRYVLAPLADAINEHAGDPRLRAVIDVVDGDIRANVRRTDASRSSAGDQPTSSRPEAGRSSLPAAIDRCLEVRRLMIRTDQSWTLRKLRNEVERVAELEQPRNRRAMRKKTRSVKPTAEELVRMKELQAFRELVERMDRLVELAIGLEDEVMSAVYGREQLAADDFSGDVEGCYEGLMTLLRDLYVCRMSTPDLVTLVLYGETDVPMFTLAEAYYQLGGQWDCTVEVYRVTTCQKGTPASAGVIRLDGPPGDQPSGDERSGDQEFEARRVRRPEKWFESRQSDGVVGIGLVIRGPAALPLFDSEAGLHRFEPPRRGTRCLVDSVNSDLRVYRPPVGILDWHSRPRETARRVYNRKQEMIRDGDERGKGGAKNWTRRSLVEVLEEMIRVRFESRVMAHIGE